MCMFFLHILESVHCIDYWGARKGIDMALSHAERMLQFVGIYTAYSVHIFITYLCGVTTDVCADNCVLISDV